MTAPAVTKSTQMSQSYFMNKYQVWVLRDDTPVIDLGVSWSVFAVFTPDSGCVTVLLIPLHWARPELLVWSVKAE